MRIDCRPQKVLGIGVPEAPDRLIEFLDAAILRLCRVRADLGGVLEYPAHTPSMGRKRLRSWRVFI